MYIYVSEWSGVSRCNDVLLYAYKFSMYINFEYVTNLVEDFVSFPNQVCCTLDIITHSLLIVRFNQKIKGNTPLVWYIEVAPRTYHQSQSTIGPYKIARKG